MPTVTFHTLGCRLNQADTALLADDLSRHGFTLETWGKPSDLLVINSCSVTGVAAQKTRQLVRATRRRCPQGFLVLLGCEATAEAATWQNSPDIDMLVTNPKPPSLAALLPPGLVRPPSGQPIFHQTQPQPDDFCLQGTGLFWERTRANLKIQEGCDFHCTYCIVPSTRGHARSRRLSDVLAEAERLVKQGFKEIVLTGVNISTYSSDGCDLPGLLRRLLELGDGFRLRLGSTEPGENLLPSIVELMAVQPRLCRFLHLPLQYGDDDILRRMGRRHYDCQSYADQVQDACRKIPGLCLGTDIIVGFPGETEQNFRRCQQYLESLPFGLMHVFPFSPRHGTPAATFGDRPASAIVTNRVHCLMSLAEAKTDAFAAAQIGQTLPVLLEARDGWSDNYLKVQIANGKDIPQNTLVQAKITGIKKGRILQGVLVPQA